MPRRPASAGALVVVVAATAWAHTILRGDRWAYEWTWGLFQYQLVTVLVAPVVAGAAAWEAVALRPVTGTVRAGGRSTAFAALVAARVLVCTAVGLAVGVIPVFAAIWRVRGAEPPPVEALLTTLPAGAQLAAVAATSFVIADRWPRPLVVPILAVAWFAGLIAGNVLLPEQVARVGGATASLIGLRVPPSTQLLQIAVGAAVALAALGATWAASVGGTAPGPRLAAVAGPLVVLALLVGAQPGGRPLFERRSVATTCLGANPTWCLADPYVGAVGTLQARAEPALREIDAVGAPRPERIAQGRVGRTAVEEVLHGDAVLVPAAIIYSWLRADCTVPASSQILEDLSRWVVYVEDRLARRRPVAEGSEASDLRSAAQRIVMCERA